MQEYNAKIKYNVPGLKVEGSLFVVSFEEDETFFLYAPAFDVTGYGDTFEEAKESLDVSLEEFIRYTHNKKTFIKELRRLGWKLKGSEKKLSKAQSPDFDGLLHNNDQFKDIVNNKQFAKLNMNIPAFA